MKTLGKASVNLNYVTENNLLLTLVLDNIVSTEVSTNITISNMTLFSPQGKINSQGWFFVIYYDLCWKGGT